MEGIEVLCSLLVGHTFVSSRISSFKYCDFLFSAKT
jgi:hypothetical protein